MKINNSLSPYQTGGTYKEKTKPLLVEKKTNHYPNFGMNPFKAISNYIDKASTERQLRATSDLEQQLDAIRKKLPTEKQREMDEFFLTRAKAVKKLYEEKQDFYKATIEINGSIENAAAFNGMKATVERYSKKR